MNLANTRASNRKDPSTLSNAHQITASHLSLDITVDFERKVLKGKAEYSLNPYGGDVTEFVVDSKDLSILSVIVTDSAGKESDATFILSEPSKNLESSTITVSLPSSSLPPQPAIPAIDAATMNPYFANDKKTEKKKGKKGGKAKIAEREDAKQGLIKVSYVYETSPKASAAQWLPPAQTNGGKYPYFFTQCQAIHARSLYPCQDSPAAKFTYDGTLRVPDWATGLMSAISLDDKTTVEGGLKVFRFSQPVPIPSYLMAVAVGEIGSVAISERCRVYSEPGMVEAVAHEFAQTEDFLQIAEELTCPYLWGRYDILCLPPSFPYGGMENPCLTFVTPTLLAGDRSLASVVAHEISHSWTGNLITNATWEHFWLNEGWTVWLERRIMQKIEDKKNGVDLHEGQGRLDSFEFLSGLGLQHLQEDVEVFCADGKGDLTVMVPCLDGIDPDDAFSSVPYEKGFNLIYSLERLFGADQFELFVRAYIRHFAYKAITSYDFYQFVKNYFVKEEQTIQAFDWESRFYSAGMPPPFSPPLDSSLSTRCTALAKEWLHLGDKINSGEIGTAVSDSDLLRRLSVPSPDESDGGQTGETGTGRCRTTAEEVVDRWNNNQRLVFLDTLLEAVESDNANKSKSKNKSKNKSEAEDNGESPSPAPSSFRPLLPHRLLPLLASAYGLNLTRNSELVYRLLKLCLILHYDGPLTILLSLSNSNSNSNNYNNGNGDQTDEKDEKDDKQGGGRGGGRQSFDAVDYEEEDCVVPRACKFVTSQGRMKFVRPLYRAMLLSGTDRARARAIETFALNKDFYHPIAQRHLAAAVEAAQKANKDDNSSSSGSSSRSYTAMKDAVMEMGEAVGAKAALCCGFGVSSISTSTSTTSSTSTGNSSSCCGKKSSSRTAYYVAAVLAAAVAAVGIGLAVAGAKRKK